jgi:hypothetical protein
MSTTTASAPPPSVPLPCTPRARPAAARPFAGPASRGGRRPGGKGNNGPRPEAEHEILFQNYFKSVGPRTYAVQVKRATNGNHYLVLTEGQRDPKTDEVRKTRLFLFSEDFAEFFKLMKSTAEFIRAHPVPEDVKRKRQAFWAKQGPAARGAAQTSNRPPARPQPTRPEPAAGVSRG